jgi:Flp pilus assembly protein TadB
MKHKLVTLYLLLLIVACFCQVAVKKEGIAACSTYSLNCLDAAKSTNQGLPIPYEFTSLTQSTNSTESPGQQALAIGLSIALIICCCCTCIIGIVITLLIVACVGFSTVLANLAVFSPCLVALGCGACVGAVGGATAGVVGGAVGGTVGGSNRV